MRSLIIFSLALVVLIGSSTASLAGGWIRPAPRPHRPVIIVRPVPVPVIVRPARPHHMPHYKPHHHSSVIGRVIRRILR